MTISPTATLADFHLRLRTAMMTVRVIAWVLLIPAALLVKQPPETASSGEPARNGSIASGAGMSVGHALRTPQFAVLALTFFLLLCRAFRTDFHMVSYAMICGSRDDRRQHLQCRGAIGVGRPASARPCLLTGWVRSRF